MIGIVIYSQTGNTLYVANKIHESLKKEGFKVHVERVEASRNMKSPQSYEITFKPEIEKYDTLIFASYIEGFMLCPVMKDYLEELNSYNKDAYTLVTHYFPFSFLGGKNGLKKMNTILKDKFNINGSYIVDWSNKKKEFQIDSLVSDITNKIKNDRKLM